MGVLGKTPKKISQSVYQRHESIQCCIKQIPQGAGNIWIKVFMRYKKKPSEINVHGTTSKKVS